jgi:integrase
VLTKYQRSDNFRQLAERTRNDYVKHIRTIEREFGDMPIAALDDKRTRGILLEWRDRIAETSRRQADYAWSVLSLVLAWGLDRTLVPANPCERGGRLYRASRVDKIWTAADESLFLARAPSRMHLPLHLALWTGQRQGDLVRLPWSSYDGKFIRLRQGKTGVR